MCLNDPSPLVFVLSEEIIRDTPTVTRILGGALACGTNDFDRSVRPEILF